MDLRRKYLGPVALSDREYKNRVRRSTRGHFIKKGICEDCKEPGKTTWHHLKYLMVHEGLRRKDLRELCRKCHDARETAER